MIELWLIRHGQTIDNIQKILAGHQPGQLTNLGVKQAKQTGEFLKKEKFDFAYVSDLARTKATFQNIHNQMVNKIPDNKITYTPLMREKGGGEYEGKPLELFRKTAADKKIPLRQFKGKDGECWNDVYVRAEKFLLTLAINHLKVNQNQKQDPQEEESKENNQPSLDFVKLMGVTHGGFIMEVHNVIEFNYQNKEPNINNVAKNCSIHKIQISLSKDSKLNNINQITFKDLEIVCIDRNNDNHCKDVK
ncbi:hypothetical protein ABPG74_020345 [Tetrahymena malaccensis]